MNQEAVWGAAHRREKTQHSLVLPLAIFAAIAAWLNTQIILKELSEIKAKLGIA